MTFRITRLALLAAAMTAGASFAQAQSYNTGAGPVTGSSASTPAAQYPQAGQQGGRHGMQGRPMHGHRPMGSAAPMGSSGGMTDSGGGMSGGRVATPSDPLAGVTLPSQPGVGNGAFNGGGLVLEHLPDGTTRVVR